MVFYVLKDEEVEIVFKFNGLGAELFIIRAGAPEAAPWGLLVLGRQFSGD